MINWIAMLVRPDIAYHGSFVDAWAEEPGGPDYLSDILFPGGTVERWADPAVFARYVDGLNADAAESSPRPPHFVPGTTWWWTVDGVFIGRISVRHRLNDRLRNGGGHIGYWVRPSARRQGHARAAFLAVLPHAHRLGIDPALVTCDDDNIGSRRVIEAAGGAFERQIGIKRLYWVPTSGRVGEPG